ncbi:MAG: amino acid adenylation domain-containing protein [Candidatus Levybacteria bacterium]|nr:amino acid adenylation domain-containing protein [Candidatus Levybacteria bacterium]
MKNAVSLFEKQVTKHPDKVAVEYRNSTITYLKLNEESNKFANYLLDLKVERDDTVALFLSRSVGMISTIFGVEKAGCAYLPINTNNPINRIMDILNDSKSRILVTEHKFKDVVLEVFYNSPFIERLIFLDKEHDSKTDFTNSKKLWNFVSAKDDLIESSGWVSSYTNNPFSRSEIDELIGNVLTKISANIKKDTTILEIGSGSGLIAKEIAPKVHKYICADISDVVLKKSKQMFQHEDINNIEFLQINSDNTFNIKEKVDVVIINSVVQFYINYSELEKVISYCLSNLNQGGIIFIGDIRDPELKDSFYESLSKKSGTDVRENNENAIALKKSLDKDLYVSKKFFIELLKKDTRIKSIESSSKIGNIKNELSMYRYDVVIEKEDSNKLKNADNSITYFPDNKDISVLNPGVVIDNEQLAYVIYTSGSTGKPKGVMIEHKSLFNRLEWMQNEYHLDENDKILFKTPYSFDVSVWEIFWWAMYGSQLVILEDGYEGDPQKILEITKKKKVSILHFVPSMLNVFLLYFDTNRINLSEIVLRKVFTSGEALTMDSVNRFRTLFSVNNTELHNLYGPTEAAIDITYFNCNYISESSEYVPIGKAIANNRVFIADKYLNEVSKGDEGEIVIQGINLARGYLNNTVKTDESFVPDSSGIRTYKTGDFGIELPDGNIKYLGRKDNQIKIRGNRIELDEIRKAVLENSSISDCCIIDSDELNEDKKIICFYISNQPIQEENLIQILKRYLPIYSIPNLYIKINEIPTTLHGKLDRTKLLNLIDRDLSTTAKEEQKVYTETQRIVTKIFENHLKTTVRIDSDFFRIGGNSLLAMVVINEISSEFKIKLPISIFFKNPTPSKLSYIIDSQEKGPRNVNFSPKIPVGLYPASHNQIRSFFLNNLDNFSFYNIIQVCELPETIDLDHLEKVIGIALESHDIFKTILFEYKGVIYQKINDSSKEKVSRLKLNQVELERFIKKQKESRIDLSKDLPIKIFLIKKEAKHLLLMNIHHSACDARSLEIFNTQISKLYLDCDIGNNNLTSTYIDFSIAERNDIANSLEQAELFWKDYLYGYKDTKLPVDLNFKKDDTSEGVQPLKLEISNDLTEQILRFCNNNGITEFNFFITLFGIFLSKVSSESEVIIGTPIANRAEEHFWETIGYFANIIPLRFDVSNKSSFRELCSAFRENYLGCMDNAFVPFDKLVDRIEVKRISNTNPVFQTLFSFKDTSTLGNDLILSKSQVLSDDVGDMSLIFDVIKKESDFEINLRFNSKLFLQDTAKRFLENFETLMQNTLSDNMVDAQIGKVQLMNEKQVKKMVELSTGKTVSFDKKKKLFDYIMEGAHLDPEHIAIVDHDRSITYKELTSRIINYASFLKENGVKEGDFVPVIMERNIPSLVSIYSVMYCGAAYIPIVPEYPVERIRYITESNGVSMIVNASNSHELETELKETSPGISWINYSHDISNIKTEAFKIKREEADIACVFYTSGSTGKPKGILCPHSGYINIVDYIARKYSLSKRTVAGHTSNFTFDISLGIMNAVFSKGGTLVLLSSDELKDPEQIKRTLVKSKINFAHFVPTILNHLNLEDVELESLASGAEKISPNLAKSLSNKFNFFFEYGPTESSIFTTVWERGGEETIDMVPIGKPVDNARVYILDENLNFVPVGTPGELYIAGAGVSRGYLNDFDKTREVFIQDKLEPARSMYKTGDIGKFIHDGNIIFLGRKDNQIKIGGHRIEIGEIENLVLKHEEIASCYVDVQTNDSEFSSIVLYYSSKKKVGSQILRAYLKEFLPNYLIPSKVIYVAKMPNKVNGKIDIDRLRQIKDAFQVLDQDLTPEQSIVKNIWCKVLNITTLDLYSDFFELGGSSLKILETIYYLKKSCDITVSVSDFYKNTTFKNFCDLVFSKEKSVDTIFSNLSEKSVKQEIKRRDSVVKNRKVLLTGSTGFLGSHILKELITSDCFSDIYLLIRGRDLSEAKRRIEKEFKFYYPHIDLVRTKVVLGDLSVKDMGISQKDKNMLKGVDTVINCAAKVQHLGKQEEFEMLNTYSVNNIIETLNKRDLEFIQISTLSIFGSVPKDKNIVYEDDLGIGQTFDNFYDETKFKAEVYLEDFYKSGGRGGIFRLGNIMNDSYTGLMQKNLEENAFTMMLQSVINTKKLYGLDKYITNISPVNKCAEFIVKSICNYNLQGNVVNVHNPNLISMDELIKLINQVGKYDIDKTNNDLEIPEVYVPYLANYLNIENKNTVTYDNTNFYKLAEELKFTWPMIDILYVSKIISHLIKSKII